MIFHEHFMKRALRVAKKGAERGEVPVGALICRQKSEHQENQGNQRNQKSQESRRSHKEFDVISESFNLNESSSSALMHAEMVVIQEASRKLKRWRLSDCYLYVTLEPCIMCSGAIIRSRIGGLVYGAKDSKAGGVDSLYHILSNSRLNHRPQVKGGVLSFESSQLLKDFFKERRKTV